MNHTNMCWETDWFFRGTLGNKQTPQYHRSGGTVPTMSWAVAPMASWPRATVVRKTEARYS